MKKTIALMLTLAVSFGAHATIIDNGTFTTDTDQGLNFLDIDETGGNSFAYYQAGFTQGGQTWRLATIQEIDALFSAIVGYAVNHTSVNSVNFAPGGAKAILDLVADPSIDNSADLGLGFYGYYDPASSANYNSLGIHYSCCNDTHQTTLSTTSGNRFAWMVSSTSVPAPAPLALFGLGLLGLGVMRKRTAQTA